MALSKAESVITNSPFSPRTLMSSTPVPNTEEYIGLPAQTSLASTKRARLITESPVKPQKVLRAQNGMAR
jgi:hypothetical protein